MSPGVPDRKHIPILGAQTVPKTVPVGKVFTRWGLALSERQIPQIVENIEKAM